MSAPTPALRWTTSEALIAEGLYLLSMEAARDILRGLAAADAIEIDPLPGDPAPETRRAEAATAAQRLIDVAALRCLHPEGILVLAAHGRYSSKTRDAALALLDGIGGAA